MLGCSLQNSLKSEKRNTRGELDVSNYHMKMINENDDGRKRK